jgi:uncharacterized alkaline shock family protein YloU
METQDTITVAPSALITIARQATLGVSGVARMGNTSGGVGQWLRRTPSAKGVRITVQKNTAAIELYVILKADTNMREVSRDIQREVARAMHDIVGLNVLSVDIHIENVDFDSSLNST